MEKSPESVGFAWEISPCGRNDRVGKACAFGDFSVPLRYSRNDRVGVWEISPFTFSVALRMFSRNDRKVEMKAKSQSHPFSPTRPFTLSQLLPFTLSQLLLFAFALLLLFALSLLRFFLFIFRISRLLKPVSFCFGE